MKLDELQGDIELFEMANLDKDDTGVDKFIFISTKVASHGPRVKYFRKCGDDQPSATITISDEPELKEQTNGFNITAKELKNVKQFVKLNNIKLLDFWNNGNKLTRKEVNKFIDSLVKVN